MTAAEKFAQMMTSTQPAAVTTPLTVDDHGYEDIDELVDAVAEKLQDAGYGANVSDTRIYVTRELSRRRQSMGYVEVEESGAVDCSGLERATATIRDLLAA